MTKDRELPRAFLVVGLVFSACALGSGVAAGYCLASERWGVSVAGFCVSILLTLLILFGPGEELMEQLRQEEAESLRKKRDRLTDRIEKLS